MITVTVKSLSKRRRKLQKLSYQYPLFSNSPRTVPAFLDSLLFSLRKRIEKKNRKMHELRKLLQSQKTNKLNSFFCDCIFPSKLLFSVTLRDFWFNFPVINLEQQFSGKSHQILVQFVSWIFEFLLIQEMMLTLSGSQAKYSQGRAYF